MLHDVQRILGIGIEGSLPAEPANGEWKLAPDRVLVLVLLIAEFNTLVVLFISFLLSVSIT